MVGFFIVKSVDGNTCEARLEHDDAIEGTFYLPYMNRQGQCDIAAGSRFFGVLDPTIGFGALLVGFENCDFQKKFGDSITVSGTVQANECKAGDISLHDHLHRAGEMLMSPEGPCSGTTGTPTMTPEPGE